MAGKAAPGERGFRAQAAIAAVAASAAAAMAAAPSRADAAIRPPGARDEGDFAARCIRYGRCMEACPYQAIHADAGLNAATAGMPLLDVRAQACRLCEDLPCIAACPTEALHALTSREEVRMGVAVIRRDVCLAVRGMRCEVCYRACPLIDSAIAIELRPRRGDSTHALFEPIVNVEACTGCGLCVQRCPVSDPVVAVEIVRDKARAVARIEEEQARSFAGFDA